LILTPHRLPFAFCFASLQLTIAIAFGFGISVLAYAIGPISGGHINPAVTFAMMATGEINPILGLLYWVVQFGGAVCGSFLLWVSTIGLTDGCDAAGEDYFDGVCTGSAKDDGFGPAYMLGVNSVSPRITIYSAFILEAVGTYLLVFTVFCSAVSPKSGAANAAPIAIGWSVMLAHIILIPFTGCGINPARSFGPMIVDMIAGYNPWTRGWWVYYSAPFAG
jgi:MIP family channel proteins